MQIIKYFDWTASPLRHNRVPQAECLLELQYRHHPHHRSKCPSSLWTASPPPSLPELVWTFCCLERNGYWEIYSISCFCKMAVCNITMLPKCLWCAGFVPRLHLNLSVHNLLSNIIWNEYHNYIKQKDWARLLCWCHVTIWKTLHQHDDWNVYEETLLLQGRM